jgi:hypothetical protein
LSHTETSVAEAGTGTVLTHPLDEFYRLAKRPLPGIEPVDGAALPEPYRSLLVHERDMTSTLGQFHGDDIYYREVLLLAKRSQRPVEYGAIKIHLGQFPGPARNAITGAGAPLGQLLHDYGIGHLSRLSGFLRVECDDHIGGLFGLDERPLLFGRRNTLYDATAEHRLAEIVEILPPA